MDRQYIESEHIIERYLAGQLTLEESEAFEVYCLEHPQIAEELEYARSLMGSLTVAFEESDDRTSDGKPDSSRFSGNQRLSSVALVPTAAFSFAVAIGILVFWSLTTPRSTTVANPPVSPVAGPVISLGARRSVDMFEPQRIAAGNVSIIDIETGADSFTHYKTRFLGPDEETIWQSGRLVDNAGAVRVVLDARSLMHGEYRFALYGISEDNGDGILLRDYVIVVSP